MDGPDKALLAAIVAITVVVCLATIAVFATGGNCG